LDSPSDEISHELVGRKENCGSEREHFITCETCTEGTYVVHVLLDLGELGEDGRKIASQLKHAFTSYGPAELYMTTQVPEFSTMDVWN